MSRGKTAIPLDLPQPIKLGASKGDKQTAIYEALRDAILSRLLKSGEHLPATRTLAERWQVSRGTVEAVFDRLRQEGYIIRRSGSGSVVSAVVPDTMLKVSSSTHIQEGRNKVGSSPVHNEPDIEPQLSYNVPFIARMPDPLLLDLKTWGACLSRAIEKLQPQQLVTGRTFGIPSLRRQIAEYLRVYRGIPCEVDDVIVTTGIRSATEMVARILLCQGDVAAVEDPGYLWARTILMDTGATLKYIRVDNEGMNVDDLSRYKDVKLVYVTPAHQAPLGITMTATRRLKILDWAEKNDAFIIEDDYDSEFNYNVSPLPAIKAIDRIDRVIYCGSFNKTIFPDMRIGFCIIPRNLKGKLNKYWEFSGRAAGVIEQTSVGKFIAEGYFYRHLRLARQTYQTRRDLLISCLKNNAANEIKITGENAGFHFILWLPTGVNEASFCNEARRKGIYLQPLKEFCHRASYPPAVLVGYAALTEVQIKYSGRILGCLIDATHFR
ncbi:MocR-like pyridoxine biosynthesis transcription factor PdxR [Brenneria tiliae]|uniref:MocR-like pyridoxine biosynthesis transcription factor PdxR n=1 Tax=Brenneria tiliae TaxID=2914984 RepID=UPI002014BE8E|nr:PLP-dependent aminotransferase family protein [Brenneria tiliae]MCL2895882.1 PLP-dependent aminotransferase family protein [Brenneria tiliae]MCL2900422.1 PLP-dependent aminotransferase family protein [Brenneria tiliae]